MYTRYDKMREVEQKISDLKKERFHQWTRPVSAFITFEEEDAYNLAQYYEPEFTISGRKKPAKGKFLEEDLFLIPATEPTNIIWENRHLTNAERYTRLVKVILIVLVLALACFVLIFVIKSFPIWINKTWEDANCNAVEKTYGN